MSSKTNKEKEKKINNIKEKGYTASVQDWKNNIAGLMNASLNIKTQQNG